MDERRDLLAAYDAQLRTEAETRGASTVERLGPLHLAVFPGRGGFVTYRDLGGADAAEVGRLVAAARAWSEERADVLEVEWKTRGHDRAPGLHEHLLEHGFVPDDPETVMVGEARLLVADVPLPPGVEVRRVTDEEEVRAMHRATAEAFGDGPEEAERMAASALRSLRAQDGTELWVAVADGGIVSTGRLEPVQGTAFAGLWGGATLAGWRGRGLYRALVAARARSALEGGSTLVVSDCTEDSRPILERSGLVPVTTTTPYTWRR